jgi:hypothetical protein
LLTIRYARLIKFTSVAAAAVALVCAAQVADAEAAAAPPPGLPKGHRILVENGLQIQGMVSTGDPFHLATYQNLNYTAVNWIWDSRVSDLGPAPGSMPWARWVRPGANPPTTAELPPRNGEGPYQGKLLALSLGDEPNLNDDAVRTQYVNWFNAIQNDPAYANTILYMNNFGGQVSDAALGDFISRAHPDMISFDTYPYRYAATDNPTRVQPVGGSPTNWYADFRRYREFAKAFNIPVGTYRQTYGSVSEGVRPVAESELRLQTFAALAFNAKYLNDFTYNTGANIFFEKAAGGDNQPNAMYAKAAAINAEARNLGKALVRLTPVADAAGSPHTTSMMFIRGKHSTGPGTSAFNDFPGYTGFAIDPSSQNYTDWEFGRNDPYLSGPFNDPGTTNLGTLNDGLDGDVIISWFNPLDESFDGDAFSNQVYLMVTNGLADMDGDATQTRQRIKLNFGSSGVRFPYNHLEKLDRATGTVVDVPLIQLNSNTWQLDIVLDGGTAELFKFPTGAPFVGVTPVPEPGALTLVAAVLVLRRRRARAYGATRCSALRK